MRYMDVTLAPEDIEWSTPDAWGGLKEAVFDDARFEVFVDEQGVEEALGKATRLHRIVSNQLIERAVRTPDSSEWAARTIWFTRAVKRRRNELRRRLRAVVGLDAAEVVIRRLDESFPRAEWGALS